jgi:hypothetical protein
VPHRARIVPASIYSAGHLRLKFYTLITMCGKCLKEGDQIFVPKPRKGRAAPRPLSDSEWWFLYSQPISTPVSVPSAVPASSETGTVGIGINAGSAGTNAISANTTGTSDTSGTVRVLSTSSFQFSSPSSSSISFIFCPEALYPDTFVWNLCPLVRQLHDQGSRVYLFLFPNILSPNHEDG